MAPSPSNHALDRLRTLPILASVRVCGRSLKLSEFLEWTPGKVLTFDQTPNAPLSILVGNRVVGQGQAVKVGQQMGLRLQRIRHEPNDSKHDQ